MNLYSCVTNNIAHCWYHLQVPPRNSLRVLIYGEIGEYFMFISAWIPSYIEGILLKGSYLPCVSMAGSALLAGYPWHLMYAYYVCCFLLFDYWQPLCVQFLDGRVSYNHYDFIVLVLEFIYFRLALQILLYCIVIWTFEKVVIRKFKRFLLNTVFSVTKACKVCFLISETAQDFEYDDLYVNYFVDIPQGE